MKTTRLISVKHLRETARRLQASGYTLGQIRSQLYWEYSASLHLQVDYNRLGQRVTKAIAPLKDSYIVPLVSK